MIDWEFTERSHTQLSAKRDTDQKQTRGFNCLVPARPAARFELPRLA